MLQIFENSANIYIYIYIYIYSYVYVYVYDISYKNTFGVKKVRPSKVESYLEVNT